MSVNVLMRVLMCALLNRDLIVPYRCPIDRFGSVMMKTFMAVQRTFGAVVANEMHVLGGRPASSDERQNDNGGYKAEKDLMQGPTDDARVIWARR